MEMQGYHKLPVDSKPFKENLVRILCLIMLGSCLMAIGSSWGGDEVVATMNDISITLDELTAYLQFINVPLALSEDARHAVRKDLEAKDSIAMVYLERYAFLQSLVHAFKQENLPIVWTPDEAFRQAQKYRESVRKLWNEVMDKQLVLTEADYEEGMNQFRDQLSVPDHARVTYIFVESPDRFLNEKNRLEQWSKQEDFSENFDAYVHQASQQGGAMTGGTISRFEKGRYSPLLESAIFAADIGQVTGPVQTDKGVFFLRVDDRQLDQLRPLGDCIAYLNVVMRPEKVRCFKEGRIQQLKARQSYYVYDESVIPEKDAVIVQIGDSRITWDQFISAFPEERKIFQENPDRIPLVAQVLAERELILRDFQESFLAEDVLIQERLRVQRNVTLAETLLDQLFHREVSVTEEDVRSYYDAHQGIYHTGTGKHLKVLRFLLPEMESRLEQERVAQTMLDEARSFREQVSDATDFLALAEQWVQSRTYLRQETHGPWWELPADWKNARSLVNYPLFSISEVIESPEGPLVFFIVSEDPQQILPYEEVRNRVKSAVMALKKQGFENSLKARMFEEYGLEIKLRSDQR